MMNVNLGDKIEVSALELTMWLDECIYDAVVQAGERTIDTTEIARQRVVELFKKKGGQA